VAPRLSAPVRRSVPAGETQQQRQPQRRVSLWRGGNGRSDLVRHTRRVSRGTRVSLTKSTEGWSQRVRMRWDGPVVEMAGSGPGGGVRPNRRPVYPGRAAGRGAGPSARLEGSLERENGWTLSEAPGRCSRTACSGCCAPGLERRPVRGEQRDYAVERLPGGVLMVTGPGASSGAESAGVARPVPPVVLQRLDRQGREADCQHRRPV
jgi:hypothetical protein